MGEGYQVQTFRQWFMNGYFSYMAINIFRYQMQGTGKCFQRQY